jgi:DNA-binding MarR family transcriptional regulator
MMTKPKSVINRLRLAAEWYVKKGYYVFPLKPGTKDPFLKRDNLQGTGRGCYDATTDLDQIRRWWHEYPNANIGIHCGPSGMLMVDGDLYKPGAGSLDPYQVETVTVITAHHGKHLWYRMPVGKRYGNSRGTLPKWLDIRGYGGYVVAPPSILVEDGQCLPYAFAAGRKPTEIDVADLPTAIADVLEAAQSTRESIAVHFSANPLDAPDLAQWHLSDEIVELIHHGAPKGQRSEADYRVILALGKVGASDDDIRSVFAHYAIGAKVEERGEKYLAHSIGKARAWLLDHPPEPPAPIELLNQARQWARSPACLDHLRAGGVCRVSKLVLALDALLELAQQRRTMRVVASQREIADRYAVDGATVNRHLAKLIECGLLTTEPSQYGTLIDLSLLCDKVDLTATLYKNCESVAVRSTPTQDFIADHRMDDAFTSYPYAYAIKRRQAPTVLLQSLGESGLLLWDALQDGGTVKELAQVTGLTVAAVRSTLKKFAQAGLLFIWQEGCAKVYELHPNAEERLEERREYMVTAGIGQLRAARNANEIAAYAQRKLQGRMPLEPGQKSKLENRRDRADQKAAASYDALLSMGIDPRAKVRQCPPRHRIRVDHGEEWVSIHRPIVEMWDELAPSSFADRYRMMGMAGYTRREIDDAKRMAAKVGRGPLQFKGFHDPVQAAVAA